MATTAEILAKEAANTAVSIDTNPNVGADPRVCPVGQNVSPSPQNTSGQTHGSAPTREYIAPTICICYWVKCFLCCVLGVLENPLPCLPDDSIINNSFGYERAVLVVKPMQPVSFGCSFRGRGFPRQVIVGAMALGRTNFPLPAKRDEKENAKSE